MGCDIHFFTETRNKDTGKWEKVGKIFDYPYYDPNRESKIDEEDGFEWNPKYTDSFYQSRNYDLFSILADVRNGYGFAGIKTGMGFKPIAMPKGLPKDASREIKKLSKEYGADGHSHSYFTLDEIFAYDWQQRTVNEGFVSLSEYKEWVKNGKGEPESYCGGVDGRMIRKVTMKQMEDLISGKMKPEVIEEDGAVNADGTVNKTKTDAQYYCKVHWGITYYEASNKFPDKMKKLIEILGREPQDIRIVFWFDN
jgi:hypothetical protein